MPYWLSLALFIGVWWILFSRAGDFLHRFGVDWADMATARDITHQRAAGVFVLGKHIVFAALLFGGVLALAIAYPDSRGVTYIVGLGWSLFFFPVGLLVAVGIVLLWLVGV